MEGDREEDEGSEEQNAEKRMERVRGWHDGGKGKAKGECREGGWGLGVPFGMW